MNLYQVCLSVIIGSLFLCASPVISPGYSHTGIHGNISAISNEVPPTQNTEGLNPLKNNLCMATSLTETSINITPSGTTVGVNEDFLITISIHPSQEISGIQFDLNFNPALLEAIDVTEGNLFRSSQTYFNQGIIDNDQGIISHIYGGAILGNTTLPGIFAQIAFTSRQTGGISPLTFSNVVIGTPQGTPLPLSINHGTVVIEKPNQIPHISFTHPPEGAHLSGGIVLTGTAHDPDGVIQRVEIRVNKGAWKNALGTDTWTYFWDTAHLPDGTQNLSARSFDGTDYSMEHTLHVLVDNTPPSTAVIVNGTQGQQNWYTSNITITLQAIDKTSFIKSIRYRINTEDFQVYNKTFFITSEGTTQITYYSLDEAGNIEPEKTVYITLDKTSPETSIHLNPPEPTGNNGWYTTPVTINLLANDTVSRTQSIHYKLNEGGWYTQNGTESNVTITVNGLHLFTYYSSDNAGNIEESKSLPLKIDTGKPMVTLIKPKSNMLYLSDRELIRLPGPTVSLGKITVTATALDTLSGIEKIQILIDQEIRHTVTHPPFQWIYDDRSLLPRRHTLQIKTFDFAGNIQVTEKLTFWIVQF